MKRQPKILLCLFLFGVSIFAVYSGLGLSHAPVFVISSLLLSIPLGYAVLDRNSSKQFVLLSASTTFLFQSLWLLGSGYVQGTDGTIHLYRSRKYLTEGSLSLGNSGSVSSEFPNMYVLSNMLVDVTGLSHNLVLLLINPVFGIVTVVIVYAVLRRLLDEVHARLSSVLVLVSLTFVSVGTEVRTESMGIAVAAVVIFLVVLRHREETAWLRATSLLLIFSLVVTHIVASVHFLVLGMLAVTVVISVQILDGYYVNTRGADLLLITSLLLGGVMMFLNGTFEGLIITLMSALAAAMSVVYALTAGFSASGGGAASGTGAGIVVFSVVWLHRLLFLACGVIIAQKQIRNAVARKRIGRVDAFLLVSSATYLLIIVVMTFAGDAAPLNPGRIYRIFDYLSAIIIARGLLHLFAMIDTPRLPRQTLVTALVVVLMVGSLTVLPVWSIDTGLREGGEKPYLSYSERDMGIASFAETHVPSDATIYGGRRTYRLFGAFGSHTPYRFEYVTPSNEEITSAETVYYDTRYNGKKYVRYDPEFVASSDTIYDAHYVKFHKASGDQFVSNVTESD